MYDLIIIGGGPGGVAAGVYGARKKMKVALIAESFGGQSLVSADVQNWIGTKSISGFDLAEALEGHLRAQSDIEIVDGDLAERVEEIDGADGVSAGLRVSTKKGKSFETKYLLIASGSRRRKLGVPGEAEFDGKGVVYCSICDAPLFEGKTVAVVGGGNAGLEAVIDLFPYATKIYLLERSDTLKGDAVTQAKIKENPKLEIIFNATTLSISGDTFVKGLKYSDTSAVASGGAAVEKDLAVEGVFVEIGALPNSDFVKGLVKMNAVNEIISDPATEKTSNPRVWAVGDVSDVLYKQNNISAGDAIKAVLNIYDTLNKE
jgi:NADH-dependent peroxiredoxin subunit F